MKKLLKTTTLAVTAALAAPGAWANGTRIRNHCSNLQQQFRASDRGMSNNFRDFGLRFMALGSRRPRRFPTLRPPTAWSRNTQPSALSC